MPLTRKNCPIECKCEDHCIAIDLIEDAVAAEREACAQIADIPDPVTNPTALTVLTARAIAHNIRERTKQER